MQWSSLITMNVGGGGGDHDHDDDDYYYYYYYYLLLLSCYSIINVKNLPV